VARSGTLDPLSRFRYTVYINIDGKEGSWKKAAFTRVTSPRVDIGTSQYHEGGRHLNPRSITERAVFSPVTLQRGKSYSNDFINWMGAVYKAFYGDASGNTSNYRGTIVIDHHNRRGKIVKKYVLQNARPNMYMPASNFDSMDDTEVSIETLTVEYEGYLEYSLEYNQLQAILGSSTTALVEKIGGQLGYGNGTTPTSLEPGPPNGLFDN